MSYFLVLLTTMRLNLMWFVPLCVAIVFYFVIPNVVAGYQNVTLVFRRFNWAIFLSPSAHLFFGALIASVALPLRLLLLIPAFFDRGVPAYARRYLWSFLVVLGIGSSAILLQIIIWGAFPLPVDKEGYIHLRFIPFIPWPDTPLFNP